MLEKYRNYLNYIQERFLQKFFEQQKDYIFCKEGCSHCCERGQYPFSALELKYLMQGYNKLSQEEKDIIQKKIEQVVADAKTTKDEVYLHECPFLINKKCSVYEHRGIICRTHGILFFIPNEDGESTNKIPSCVNKGLNYSSVYDNETKTISTELWENSGIETEPVAYNLSLKSLLNNALTQELGLDFGEEKALVDWFK
jgi:Fe-S-cluster containining protein